MGLSDITYASVIAAIEEFLTLGKTKFLTKYGFGDARNYFLIYKGEEFPSKAIAGVAHKFIRAGNEPLPSKEFSVGKDTVEKKLKSLGFNVIYRNNLSPLVLVENEVTYAGEYDHWQDLTGVSYHYPNQYRNKIVPGRYFVYYRGVRRANNKRGQPEYFGYGRIASVWRDPLIPESTPKARWRWYCSIDNFIPFENPVPAKQPDGYIEDISNPLGWRTGVREISEEQFEKILSLAGSLETDSPETDIGQKKVNDLQLPSIDDIIVQETEFKYAGFIQSNNPAKEPLGNNKTTGTYRRSKNAKQTGDRAEEITLRWVSKKLNELERSKLTWVAHEGRTPGWDIEFISEDKDLIGIEVKGTSGKLFQNIELTAREWESARKMGGNYWLVLVTDCHSKTPQITCIKDPYSLLEKGELQIEPVIWRLSRS